VSSPAVSNSLAAAVLLVAAGVAAGAFAIKFTAVAVGARFSPFTHLGLPSSHAGRAWLLVVVIVALAALLWLALRGGEEMLWLTAVDGGGVLVPATALQSVAKDVACRHPDVVRAEARVAVKAGRVRCWVRIYCRPLADADGISRDVEDALRDTLARVVGAELGKLVMRPRVLAVRHLKRHLS
jgi:hypothetical protein